MAVKLFATHGTNGDAWPEEWETDFSTANGTTDIQSNKLRLLTANVANARQRAIYNIALPCDFDILLRITPPATWSTVSGVPIICVGDKWGTVGDDLPANGWGFWVQGSSNASRIYHRVNDSGSFIANGGFNRNGSVPKWMRARKSGTRLDMRLWDDGALEPRAWTIGAFDSTGPSLGPRRLMIVNTGGVPFGFSFDKIVVDDYIPVKQRPNYRRV